MRRLFIISLILISFIFAAEMGRIQGRVVDASTNDVIPGASVVLEGTEMGAACDENGNYLIPFAPAGTHRVTASCIGFNPTTQDLVVVISNQTTNLNFKLNPTIYQIQPTVVHATRAVVIRTQTQTSHTTTADDISKMPISAINQIITLQAGVSQSGLETHVRGGRGNEIAYFIDGVLTKAPHYGDQSVQINKDAVEEVGVVTGGFDAEYGEALSGIINIVTREGAEKTNGSFRYTTDEIFSTPKLNFGYNLYEFNIGGGLLTKSRFRYFMSSEAYLTDDCEDAKYKVYAPRFDYKLQGKLSYRLPNNKAKLIFSQFYSREQFMHFADNGGLSMMFNLDRHSGEIKKGWLSTLTGNYQLSRTDLLELKLGYTRNTRFYATRDLALEEERGRKWYEDYIFKANHFPAILMGDIPDTLKKNYLVDSLCDTLKPYHYTEFDSYTAASLRNKPFGATGFFYTVGDYRLWRYFFSRDFQANLTMTNALGKVHELKTGLSVFQENVGWFDNNLPWTKLPFWDMYNKNPLKVAFFVQDRMDFEGIIARIGMRFDYFDSKASGLKNPTNPQDTTTIQASPKWRVSPRLGFSLPITETSKMRFNYGYFFQTPTAHDLYRSTTPEVVWLLLKRANTVLGNPNLSVEKTIAYELGYENQVSDIIAFGFTAYYKDIYDLIQTKNFFALPYAYYKVENLDYGNVKGIELTMKKQMQDFWSLDLSYTLQFAKGTASSAWQAYYTIYYAQNIDPITGQYRLPQGDFWLDFDERHIINTTLGFEIPKDFGLKPLANFSTDIILSFHSGFPYTSTDMRGNQLGDQNSARMPSWINVDANLTKIISISGTNFSIFANIYNLFNTQQITRVYAVTGKPDDDGQDVTILVSDFGSISITSAYYSPQADYDHNGENSAEELYSEYMAARHFTNNNPFDWRPGFRMKLGIGLSF
jgi:outer membrane receptor protein involved in Fe transport